MYSASIFPSRFGMSKFINNLNGLIFLELDLIEDPPNVEANHVRISLNRENISVHFQAIFFSMSSFVSLIACLLSISLSIFDLVV